MSDEDDQSRIDGISTHWSLVDQAHDGFAADAMAVRSQLLHRYRGAVYRYLLSIVKDDDLAEELSQEFALNFLQGGFHKASPDRGRFRDYVKTSVVNLVRAHHRGRSKAPGPLPENLSSAQNSTADLSGDGGDFERHWRQELLDQTWAAMKRDRPVHYRLLRLRLNAPDLTSAELAKQYTEKHSAPMTSANVRKTLERAHRHFADLMLQEVAAGLVSPTLDDLKRELTVLDLLKYCGPAVDRWNGSDAGE
ncbi:MAG: sigma factor [Planctomycetaceae bacterium]